MGVVWGEVPGASIVNPSCIIVSGGCGQGRYALYIWEWVWSGGCGQEMCTYIIYLGNVCN